MEEDLRRLSWWDNPLILYYKRANLQNMLNLNPHRHEINGSAHAERDYFDKYLMISALRSMQNDTWKRFLCNTKILPQVIGTERNKKFFGLSIAEEANEMSEEKIVGVIHDFDRASEKRDVDKMLSFLAEDVVWTNNEGTFKGKEEVKRYLTWETQRITDVKVRDAGIGTIVKGNIAVHESVFEGSTSDGRRFGEIPVIIVSQFSGEKIQWHREYLDRLSMAKQAAKRWFERMIVGQIVNRIEKGLH